MSLSTLKENEEYMKFLSELPNLQKLKQEHIELKKQVQKKRRRINTLIHKYTFLNDIVGIKVNDDPLVSAVKKSFKSIGFDKVVNSEKTKKEDIQLWLGNKMIAINITGTEKPTLTKVRQASDHYTQAKERNKKTEVFGCFLINHQYKKPFNERIKEPFKSREIKDSVSASKISLVTTTTLREMLIAVILEKMTREELFNKLCEDGEVKYNRA